MALTLALLLGTTLSRWLTRPILAMTRAARAMSHGDFEVALPTPGDDELGDLVHTLDTLRNQLAARMAELRGEGHKLRAIINGMSEGVALVQDGVISVANPAFARLVGLGGDAEGRAIRDAVRVPAVGDAIESSLATRRRRLARGAGRRPRARGHHRSARRSARGARRWSCSSTSPSPSGSSGCAASSWPTPRTSCARRSPPSSVSPRRSPPAPPTIPRRAARSSRSSCATPSACRASPPISSTSRASRPATSRASRSVEVDRVVDAVLGTLQVKAEPKSIALEKKLPVELRVSAERAAVEQILTNLVDNAIKYTPAGGRVAVRAEARGGRVRLVVEDTGPGIPKEHHARLFERFYRVDDARSRDLGGTGLGLAIVKHLALANGGDVAVESDVGKGSRFIVALPQ